MQVFIFLMCALCGVSSGIVYDVLYIARVFVCGTDKAGYTVKDKIFTCLCDLIYFGALIYLKSLHLIIAFFIKKAYNSLVKVKLPRGKRNGRRKTQQSSGGNND